MNNRSWKIIINKLSDFEIKKGITSFVNPYSMLMLSRKDDIAEEVDNWHADGISLVRLTRLLFKKKSSRFSFDDTSVAPMVFTNVANKNQRLAVIGSEPDIIIKSVKFIERKYGIEVIFFRDGFMKDEAEIQQTINLLVDKKIEVVICGMGTPRQEEFLVKLKHTGWDGYSYTCGGYLHQVAKKNRDYYPVFFDRLHIRWIYRIYDEPRLLGRYLIRYPEFLSKLLWFRFKQQDD